MHVRHPLALAPLLLVSTVTSAHAAELVEDFGDDPGNLVVYEHVPPSADGPLPLVLLLHGCSQSAAAYEAPSGWRALADEHGFALVVAEQPASNNFGRCFNWFSAADNERDEGEAASLASAVRYMLSTHDVDPARVFVTGVSAGGAMTAVMLATYPELFAGGAVLAGAPYKCAASVADSFTCLSGGRARSPNEWGDLVRAATEHAGPWPRVAIWHGDDDTTVSPANALELEEQWLDVHGLSAVDVIVEDDDGAGVRRFFAAGDDARPTIERWALPDVGHAVPVDPDQGCGSLEPFFVDADLCSSERIARFFGLLDDPGGEDAGANDGGLDEHAGDDDDGGLDDDAGDDDGGPPAGCACGAADDPRGGALGFVALLLAALSLGGRRCLGVALRRPPEA